MPDPAVSVVIPVHNGGRYLAQAIDGVLAQTFADLEIIVVDDGSTDNTAEVLQRYGAPVRAVHEPNLGVSKARNRGIQETRGRYVAFLDADDVWVQRKLEQQIAELAARPSFGVAYTAFTRVTPDLRPIGVTARGRTGDVLEDLLTRGNIIGTPSTVVCTRAVLERTGGFDPALSLCADWDMWIRLACVTQFAYTDEALVLYREHEGNMSRDARLLEYDSSLTLAKGFRLPGVPASVTQRQRSAVARNYMVLAGTYFHGRCYPDFARCAVRAMRLDIKSARWLLASPARVLSRYGWS